MELVEIKDIRVNQIYKHKDGNIYIPVSFQQHVYIVACCYKDEIFITDKFEFYPKEFTDDMDLIGFLNITHKLENNKLVEIERKEFEAGDIVMFSGNENPLLIIYNSTEKRYRKRELEIIKFYRLFNGRDYADVESERIIKKIGIYGVTHEFINKILIKE